MLNVVFNPVLPRAYVSGNPRTHVIDTTLAAEVETLIGSKALGVNPAGTRLYLLPIGYAPLEVFETATNTLVATIVAFGVAPAKIAVGPGVATPPPGSAACSGGTFICKPRVTLAGLSAPPGNERMTVTGELVFGPGHPTSVLDLSAQGAQILIEDLGSGGSAVLDLTHLTTPLPPGPPGAVCGPLDGWTASPNGARHTYVNASGALGPPGCTAGSANGLGRAYFTDKRNKAKIGARFITQGSTFPAPVGPLRVSIALGASASASATGVCGTVDIPCRVNSSGTVVRCR